MKNSVILILLITILIYSCNNSENELPTLDIEVKQIITDLDQMVLDNDGFIWGWGSNTTGLLGNNIQYNSFIPHKIDSLKNIVALECEAGGAYAVDEEGNVWYWGLRILWDTPNDSIIFTPKAISNISNVKQINILGSRIYFLKLDGTICYLSWNPYAPSRFILPTDVDDFDNIIQLSGLLALNEEGVLCEIPDYENRDLELGGLHSDSIISDVVYVQNKASVYTIILKKDSTVWSWGRNSSGYLGNGTLIDNSYPNRIDSLTHIISISIEGSRCLALNANGEVYYWGLKYLDLDNNIKTCQTTPKLLSCINNIQMIKAGGGSNSILINKDGSCWEFNFSTGNYIEIFR
ncbi:MAG: hypothetical protein U9Q91_04725 [Candidatus Marinimicrobia bacterium]|nr:hypothetical protein [Candidatus Neomarinimicrobiota bacterium]